ncbi:MAG: hypothetical protein DRO04_01170 [Candidatus Iainarchaeum archaeon]|uniref:Uncharacterized protein n=1 Tax=Candidatus Iainarchaeum sp. TaxID=3101447 RepID=A0A497JHL8_9ARCH|nr:MAG: hypothetical protein DRO04_01170 [Candidatus Diapherotrites archaeon]
MGRAKIPFVCLDCGNEFLATKRRKTCPKCKSRNIRVKQELEEIVEEKEAIEEKEEEEKEEEFFRANGEKGGIEEFFKQKGEQEFFQVPSAFSDSIRLIIDTIYSPKELREFKPNEEAVQTYTRTVIHFLQERNVKISPETSLILSTAVIMFPAFLFYLGKASKWIQRYFKANWFKKKSLNHQNRESEQSEEKSSESVEESVNSSREVEKGMKNDFSFFKSPNVSNKIS